MSNELYVILAAILQDDGKKPEGFLSLFIDRYEFGSIVRQVNWENAEVKRETQMIKKFIFKIEKPVVIIKEGGTYGPRFVLKTDSMADAFEEKVKELGELVKKNRLAEEERKRKEEEERRRREEEERQEKERQKQIISERKERLAREIEEAEKSAENVSLLAAPDQATKKAWSYIVDNPYRILGISVSATFEEANASLDKLKKLLRLNAAGSFKTEYHLNGTEKPEREVSILQNALTILKDRKYKWFWFADASACAAWQSEDYRDELSRDGVAYGTYDLFLANYFYGLVFDSSFYDSLLWKILFIFYDWICVELGHEMLKSRFHEQELVGINEQELVRSFKSEIFKPLEALCETDDIKKIIRLYEIVKDVSVHQAEELKKKILSRITEWFNSREAKVCTLVKLSDEDNVITAAEAREIKKAGNAYIRETDGVIELALEAVEGEAVRYEMIKESYRHTVWQMMFGMYKAEEQDEAVHYATKCYPYCKEDDKRTIRNTFGMEAIKKADKDAPKAYWDAWGDDYYKGQNGSEKDYYKAVECYTEAAKAGNIYAMNSLGICYMKGRGVFQSDYEAANWFEKAYKAGNADGAVNLADCYIHGTGRGKDNHKGVELLLEAAKIGHPEAAEKGKKLLEVMERELKIHRQTQHEHYDLGFQVPGGRRIIVEVELNYSANVYLMETKDYEKYKACDNFGYYGGSAKQSPYKIEIPHMGSWHLVIDNGDDDMTGIITSVRTRTLSY